MTVRRFFNKSVIVQRLKTVSGNLKNYTTTATVDIHIQELDRDSRAELDMVQDRAWIGYFDIEDDNKIVEQDKITLSGIEYQVTEKTKKDYFGSGNQHIEVIFVEYTKS